MSRLDATAGAFVTNNQIIRPVRFIFMDYLGDPIRCNDSGMDITISGQSSPNLNGTYLGLNTRFANMSNIQIGDGGSQPVSVWLSGIKTLDDATLDLMGDESKWKGRLVRIWRIVWDQAGTGQGSYQHLYTGYMVNHMLKGSSKEQMIEVTIESYLAAFSQPSNRTYLMSRYFDAGDASGEVLLSAANGSEAVPGMLGGGGGSSGPGSGDPMGGGTGPTSPGGGTVLV